MYEKVCKYDICGLFLSSESALQKQFLGLYFANDGGSVFTREENAAHVGKRIRYDSFKVSIQYFTDTFQIHTRVHKNNITIQCLQRC